MPLDPFFSSDVRLPVRIRRRKPRKRVEVLNAAKKFARKQANKINFITGGPALTGFKSPKKIWDDR